MDGDNKNLTFLEHAVDEIKDYILSDQLFWPMGSDRLTIGVLLLALQRLKTTDQGSDQKLSEMETKIAAFRIQWRTNWSNKALLEFKSRLRQWELALSELLSKDQEPPVLYRHEVTLRVLLEILCGEMIQPDTQDIAHMNLLDQKLRSASTRHGFVWEPALEEGFPEQTYWYLYVLPRRRAR